MIAGTMSKQALKKVFNFIALAVMIAVGGLFCFILFNEGFYWELESEKESPNGDFTAYQYRYTSDGNRHAPYGTYVFLKRTGSTQKPYQSHTLFAGYCEPEIEVFWQEPKNLVLVCNTTEPIQIKTMASKAYGINVSLQSSRP